MRKVPEWINVMLDEAEEVTGRTDTLLRSHRVNHEVVRSMMIVY